MNRTGDLDAQTPHVECHRQPSGLLSGRRLEYPRPQQSGATRGVRQLYGILPYLGLN